MRILLAFTLFTAIASCEPKKEIGEINGARFRIDVPEKWNGGLVMYCHGYSPVPGNFDNPKLNAMFDVFLNQGYAVAQSGYAAGGWAIQEAVEDTEALRRYFGRKYGAPKETYVTGHSMGGFLTMTLLESKPAQSAAMRRWTGLRDNKEMAGTLVFFTYILKDLEERAGGNPFDNRNTIYDGTEDDNALNDHVVRYKSQPRAVAYLDRYYTPTGHLTRPMLAIHTTYDPLVPPWITNMYSKLAERADSDQFFVQQYVKHAGHCAILPAEIGRGFQQLRQWTAVGTRPAPGLNQ